MGLFVSSLSGSSHCTARAVIVCAETRHSSSAALKRSLLTAAALVIASPAGAFDQIVGSETVIGGGIGGTLGSPYDSSSFLSIGPSGGDGSLTVSNGGQVTGVELSVGESIGNTGELTITGTGSLASFSTSAEIGGTGVGILTVSDDGTFRLGAGEALAVAAGVSSTGTVEIGAAEGEAAAGAGALEVDEITFGAGLGTLVFNHTDTDYVLSADLTKGAGTSKLRHLAGHTTLTGAVDLTELNLVSGTLVGTAAASAGDILVSGTSGKSTELRLSGSNAHWSTPRFFYFSSTGPATLTLENGGYVSAQTAVLAAAPGVAAHISISGATSGLVASDIAYVGISGTAIVSLTGGGGLASISDMVLGYAPGSNALVTVSGASSTLGSYQNVRMGLDGGATVTLSNGGKLVASGGDSLNNIGTVRLGALNGTAGILNIGAAAGDTAAAAGSVAAGTVMFTDGSSSKLVFNHSETSYDFNPALQGGGALEFYSGTTSIRGDLSSYTGTFDVFGGTAIMTGAFDDDVTVFSGGRLTINDTATGQLSISSGGTLGGTGVVSDVVLAAGAALAPGNSIGTLTVSGGLDLVTGSTLEIEVNAAGQSDLLEASGAVAIANGAILSVLAENGTDTGVTYGDSTDYTILRGAALSGRFDTVTDSFAYLDAEVAYSATEATLTLSRNDISFGALGSTPNQTRAGGGVESLGNGNPLFNAVRGLPAGQPGSAFQQLSGETYAGLQTAMIGDGGILRGVALQRLSGFGPSGGAGALAFNGEGSVPVLEQVNAQIWGRGFGGWGTVDATAGTAEVNRRGGGLLTGLDAEILPDWRTGLMAGWSRSLFDSLLNATTGTTDSFHVGVYGGTAWDLGQGSLGLRLGASYAYHAVESARTVAFTGFSDRLAADYDAGTAQGFVELGWSLPMGRAVMEPYVGLAVLHQHSDGFTETGGAAALSVAFDTAVQGVSTLGLRGSAILAQTPDLTTALTGGLGWRHGFGDTDPTLSMRFASGGNSFDIAGAPMATDTALLEAGLKMTYQDRLSVDISYQGELGQGVRDHGARAGVRLAF